jgi:hypothetical protein
VPHSIRRRWRAVQFKGAFIAYQHKATDRRKVCLQRLVKTLEDDGEKIALVGAMFEPGLEYIYECDVTVIAAFVDDEIWLMDVIEDTGGL